MDIRTKLILALVSASLLSMLAFAVATYQFSAALLLQNAGAEAAETLYEQLVNTGLSVAAFAILGGVVLGILLARQIRKLAETVDRIRHGELDLRAEVVGEDEVALLARSLNEFMDQLYRSGDIFQLGELRVLVVEDNLTNRHLLEELLTNWRMDALIATDGNSALATIDSSQDQNDPIQLVVLDADVPEMQDPAFLAELARLRSRQACPIIVLAADPENLDADTLRAMGIQHVLPTPVVPSDLMQAILEEMGVSASAMEDIPDVLLTATQPRKILLAEDSPIIQKVTIGFLENWGHQVTLAQDGLAAIDLLKTQNFDLVLMDLEMPKLGGLDATRRIRAAEQGRQQRLPIIALTARATKADREACMGAGMDDYVAKPVDPKVLYRLVNSFPCRQDNTGVDTPALQADKETSNMVDWEVARNLTGGDEALLQELIDLFPVESSKQLDEIDAAIAAADAETVTRTAHTLKAGARFFSATEVVECALAIENSGRAGTFEGLEDKLVQLRELTMRLVAELKTGPA